MYHIVISVGADVCVVIAGLKGWYIFNELEKDVYYYYSINTKWIL